MDTEAIKIFKAWLKNEREAVTFEYKGNQDPFARGLRSELSAVEKAFRAALKGKLADNA